MAQNPTTSRTDDVMSDYWLSPISRREAQKVFDDISESIKVMSAQESAFSLSMAFVFMKLGVQKEEFEAFIKARVAMMDSATAAETAEASNVVAPN
jgi:hypothetical protein